ncbi:MULTISPECIES: DUF1097 domain-containing protein [Lactobacillaceae]|uniref:DUF1097 domain-containing protein n=1 Tax=Lactobacillaceae TaxID=33958 RepID=UPI0014563A63|nr:DUF1097 domain-containing protein [Lactobacillus sp. HBUAS51381]NLR10633.1 DUF1097 domain-containing protein [Lactobacillus sp. HBUAS51381]
MKISKKVWFDAIGVGLFTLVYSLIMGSWSLWMGSAAFIAVSYFFGAGFPKDKLWNILISFALGIVWGLIAFRLLQIPSIAPLWPSALMFGVMTFIVLFLQGTIMKFTIVPAWLIAWGTTMLIITNITVHNWSLFVVQLYGSMLLGIFVIGYASDVFNRIMFRLFPEKTTESTETLVDDEQG